MDVQYWHIYRSGVSLFLATKFSYMDAKEKEELLEKAKQILPMRDYILENKLGEGAFGLVVQVENNNDRQKYAIKILRSTNNENDKNAKYQKRELKLLENYKEENLWEKNILRYYRSWLHDIDNTPYLFIQTELCFKSLFDFIYDEHIAGPKIVQISNPKALWAHVFPQILNGLQALRKIGWVHRDIHPGNILIANPKPQQITEVFVKIADFGLAREIGSIIQASLPLTTAPKLPLISNDVGHTMCRAPELATGYYDYKVDLYSAGIVLYFLSRYLPEKEQWEYEITELKNGNRGRQDLSHKDDILINLIYRLMKPDPNERPTAAEALKYMKGESKRLAEKKFLVRKQGDALYHRCTTTDDSLESLQAAIQKDIGIEVNDQKLIQEKKRWR